MTWRTADHRMLRDMRPISPPSYVRSDVQHGADTRCCLTASIYSFSERCGLKFCCCLSDDHKMLGEVLWPLIELTRACSSPSDDLYTSRHQVVVDVVAARKIQWGIFTTRVQQTLEGETDFHLKSSIVSSFQFQSQREPINSFS